jgi:hypothetical protein
MPNLYLLDRWWRGSPWTAAGGKENLQELLGRVPACPAGISIRVQQVDGYSVASDGG